MCAELLEPHRTDRKILLECCHRIPSGWEIRISDGSDTFWPPIEWLGQQKARNSHWFDDPDRVPFLTRSALMRRSNHWIQSILDGFEAFWSIQLLLISAEELKSSPWSRSDLESWHFSNHYVGFRFASRISYQTPYLMSQNDSNWSKWPKRTQRRWIESIPSPFRCQFLTKRRFQARARHRLHSSYANSDSFPMFWTEGKVSDTLTTHPKFLSRASPLRTRHTSFPWVC